jgi:RNA polymerase sigma factor (sigma-70 family)
MHPYPNELIIRLAQGNRDAFSQLYKLFQARVYNTCLSYLQNTGEADEAVQDVFLEVFESAASFKGDSSVSTWIYRLAVNKCLDRIRHRKRQKRFAFMSSLFNNETGKLDFDAPDFNHPCIILENKEKAAILFKAIDKLPENQRSAFILKQVEGLSQKEIAEILNLGEKALESLLSRAKANLRKMLSAFYDKTEGNTKE